MAPTSDPNVVWRLVRKQHGVVTRRQLLEHGLSADAIVHRLNTGRLHSLHRGVYAVGRPQVSQRGRWIAAVLACGTGAALSFSSAAALWRIERKASQLEVSVPRSRRRRIAGIRIHRPLHLEPTELTVVDGIRVTNPTRTMIDLASRLPSSRVEAAVNAADRLELVSPEELRSELHAKPEIHGAATLRGLLEGDTFRLTDSELERLFLTLVSRAGLPMPDTGAWLNGFKVDFHWPELGLVVETDGLRYHRTASQQAGDRRRDQTHAKAGLDTLRFTHRQVRYEPDEVIETLRLIAERLRLRRLGVT